jgi:ankyrin repeat protein
MAGTELAILHCFWYRRRQDSKLGNFCGADIDTRNEFNNTALMYAIMRNNIEFARMLLEREAVINAQGQGDMTLLHWAVQRGGRTEVVRLLLEHGADVNARDEYGNTPSQLGSRHGYPEIVELLFEYRPKSIKQ